MELDPITGRKLTLEEKERNKLLDEAIPKLRELAKNGKLDQALEQFSTLEKQARLAVDASNTSRILINIVQMCFEVKDWKELGNQITFLSKRRAQIKAAFTKMVQECMAFVEQAPDDKTKTELIQSLLAVTSGKIHVEVERARLTKILAKMKESEGDTDAACELMQGLQVETFGSMEKREKAEFILEQMRLTLLKKDYIRVQGISRKIAKRVLEMEGFEDIKLAFHRIMIHFHAHDHQYLDIAQSFFEIYTAEKKLEHEDETLQALKAICIFLVLSPYTNEVSDFAHRMLKEKLIVIGKLESHKHLLIRFLTAELIQWGGADGLESQFRETLSSDPSFKVMREEVDDVVEGGMEFETKSIVKEKEGEERWSVLRARVVEHNIRVISKYYSQISLQRLSELLALSEAEAEDAVCEQVQKKAIYARIDSIGGVVSFCPPEDPSEVLNEWSDNVTALLGLVEQTSHLIEREMMVDGKK